MSFLAVPFQGCISMIGRSKVRKIIDAVTFPIRALFMGTEGRFGLSSLREKTLFTQNALVFRGMEKKLFIISCPIFGFLYLTCAEFLGQRRKDHNIPLFGSLFRK